MSEIIIVRHLYDAHKCELWRLDPEAQWVKVGAPARRDAPLIVDEDIGAVPGDFVVIPVVYVRGHQGLAVTARVATDDSKGWAGPRLTAEAKSDDTITYTARFQLPACEGKLRYRVGLHDDGKEVVSFGVVVSPSKATIPGHLTGEVVGYQTFLEQELLEAASRLVLSGQCLTPRLERFCAMQARRGSTIARELMSYYTLQRFGETRQAQLQAMVDKRVDSGSASKACRSEAERSSG